MLVLMDWRFLGINRCGPTCPILFLGRLCCICPALGWPCFLFCAVCVFQAPNGYGSELKVGVGAQSKRTMRLTLVAKPASSS